MGIETTVTAVAIYLTVSQDGVESLLNAKVYFILWHICGIFIEDIMQQLLSELAKFFSRYDTLYWTR